MQKKTVESEGRKTQGDLKSHYYDAIVVGSDWRIGGGNPAGSERCQGVGSGEVCDPRRKLWVLPKGWIHIDVGSSVMFGFSDKIFNALNSLEFKSLEEPIYLLGQFLKKPL